MIDPNFREIATFGTMRLVYRHTAQGRYCYTVAQGNCIQWNGDTEEDGRAALLRFGNLDQHPSFYQLRKGCECARCAEYEAKLLTR
jgi:hypothetical protein